MNELKFGYLLLYNSPEEPQSKGAGANVPSYSLPSKVKRNCVTILDWSEKFFIHLEGLKNIASELAKEEDESSPNFSSLVSKLAELQDVTQDHAGELGTLLAINSSLIAQMKHKNHEVPDDPFSSTRIQIDYDNDDVCCSLPPVATPVKLEFESDMNDYGDCSLGREEEQREDEIFVGVFSDEDQTEVRNLVDDTEVESHVQKSVMRGVMRQLRSRLVSVQETMKQRERKAQKTFLGNVEVLEASDEDNEDQWRDLEDSAAPTSATKRGEHSVAVDCSPSHLEKR